MGHGYYAEAMFNFESFDYYHGEKKICHKCPIVHPSFLTSVSTTSVHIVLVL